MHVWVLFCEAWARKRLLNAGRKWNVFSREDDTAAVLMLRKYNSLSIY